MAHAQTNREIEIKLRVADLPALIAKLRLIGASCRGRVFEQNTLYDTPSEDFRSSRRLLRLRIEKPAPGNGLRGGPASAVITSKAPVPLSGRKRRNKYKEKLERELVIQGAERWPSKLRALGFRAGFCYQKYRTTFLLPGLHLDLDETPVGTFLELEGAPQAIDRAALSLGFSPRDYIRGTYWDLFQHDCRRRRRFPKNMVFRRKNN